jgi:prepilin-type N-terminal cleavage/methylation domain-containing protein
MTHSNAPARRPRGFTLIELLTVVAIISLLIGILLPSLSRARDQAKKAKILAMLRSIEQALEMFHNDFGQYPDSKLRDDPIVTWPTIGGIVPPDGAPLSGAHWLARALVGHDTQGIDVKGLSMTDGTIATNQVTYATLATAARKGNYFEGKVFFRDNDPSSGLTQGSGDFTPTGRMIVMDDAFKSPILYYRANERASNPFCLDGTGNAAAGSMGDSAGVYRLQDNGFITGDFANSVKGWDFASTGFSYPAGGGASHWLGTFGGVSPKAADSDYILKPADAKNTFTRYMYDPNALNSSGFIKVAKSEGCVLISAGRDGIYGTDDDINNFNSAR